MKVTSLARWGSAIASTGVKLQMKLATAYRDPMDGYEVVYTKYITIKGRRLYAKNYGLEAFRILVKTSKKR